MNLDTVLRNVKRKKEEETKENEPLVRWDARTGLIHFNDKSEKVRKPKESPAIGIFARIKRWIKGDKGWKK